MVELIELFCNIDNSEKQTAAEFFKNSSRIPIKILSKFRLEKHKKVQKYLMLTLEEGPIFNQYQVSRVSKRIDVYIQITYASLLCPLIDLPLHWP